MVDGGSTDGTLDILAKYKGEFSSFISESDKGMYDAINKGFANSSGEIMGWLNSDDVLHPNSLFSIGEAFETFQSVEWLTGIPTNLDRQGRAFESGHRSRWDHQTLLSRKSGTPQQESTYWRRRLWEKSGANLNCSYRFAADFELWCRFFEHTDLVSMRAYIGAFRRHGENLSVTQKEIYEEELVSIAQHFSTKLKQLPSKHKSRFFLRDPKIRAIFYNLDELRFKMREIPLNKSIY